MAMAGGSAPVTLAGTLVMHNAEVLVGHHPGAAHRAWRAGHLRLVDHVMDLRYAAASVGSPELALIGAAVAQLSKQYRLPSCIAGA